MGIEHLDLGDRQAVSPALRSGVHYVIQGFPPSIGGAQLHTEALAYSIHDCTIPVRVSCCWRSTRYDWVHGSTIGLTPRRTRDKESDISIDTVGMEGRNLRDSFTAYSYYIFRRHASRYFARRIAFDDGTEGVVHVVRMGREHLARRAIDGAKTRHARVCITPNLHPRWLRLRDREWRRIYRAADLIFALTDVEAELLASLGLDSHRIVVTGVGPILAPHPTSLETFRHRVGLPDEPYVAFLGQQFKHKRVDLVIQAFEILATHVDPLRLVIAGPTSTETLKLSARSRMRSRIHVLGEVGLEDKTALLSHAEVLLHPSEQEAFGGVLIEAASVGTPFVTSTIPALAEVAHRLGGISVKSSAAAIAASALEVLCEDGSERALALRRASQVYSWKNLARIYLDAYTR